MIAIATMYGKPLPCELRSLLFGLAVLLAILVLPEWRLVLLRERRGAGGGLDNASGLKESVALMVALDGIEVGSLAVSRGTIIKLSKVWKTWASPEYERACGDREFAVTDTGFVAVVATEASALTEPRGEEVGRDIMAG